ncbi:unnamed protein product [Protopolystoma xenopodis]|uniref:Uncharacterized protein n=1 Tax=Protopolystoma xenopodis TaxID=117903 RepID=A0A448XN90_9PLAT|nr:unnamed protein product [Protopolystoma xenopodis]
MKQPTLAGTSRSAGPCQSVRRQPTVKLVAMLTGEKSNQRPNYHQSITWRLPYFHSPSPSHRSLSLAAFLLSAHQALLLSERRQS